MNMHGAGFRVIPCSRVPYTPARFCDTTTTGFLQPAQHEKKSHVLLQLATGPSYISMKQGSFIMAPLLALGSVLPLFPGSFKCDILLFGGGFLVGFCCLLASVNPGFFHPREAQFFYTFVSCQ